MLTPASDFFESLVSACRAGIGDDLRSVVYFNPERFDVLYARSDLATDDDRDPAGQGVRAIFVETERSGFDVEPLYTELSAEGGAEPALGEYEFTVRVFADGFVSRVIVGDHGVLTTTDGIDADAFREIAVTLRKLLAEVRAE